MWFTSVDLKDVYFHIAIAPHHRRFLRLIFQSRSYQFRVLPFGLSHSPRVFKCVIQVTLEPLQREGILILPYLEDWLLCTRSYKQAVDNTQRLLFHVAILGLRVNFQKSCLTPSQSVCFLGMQLDSRAMRATLTVGRRQILQGTLGSRFQVHYKLTFISFLRLTGLLTAAPSVIRPLTSSPVSTLVNSQTFVTSSQSTHAGSGHNQLCCIPEVFEEGQVSSEGNSNSATPSTQGGGNHGCLPQWVGRTVATPWCTGQLEPTVKGLSHQSSGTMGSVDDLKTFQARTGRKTHSRKNGKYNSGISTTRGHKVPTLSSVNEKAPVLGIQTLPFSQSKPHSRLLQL